MTEDFLAKFDKASADPEKLKNLEIEIESAINSYAKITDQMKKQTYIWNKNTNELCIIRDMIRKKMKECESDSK